MSYSLSTQAGIKNAILVKLNQSTTQAYYTDAILDDWIDDAHQFAAGYKKWPFTEGRVSTTFSTSITDDLGNYIMEYPEGWRTDSIRLLQIGGERYEKKNFYDFMKFREDEPSNDEKIFTDYGRRIYINSVGGITGTMWTYGQYLPARLDGTEANVYTIFSNYDQEANQAIVQEVLSYSAQREKKSEATIQSYHKRATDILDKMWEQVAGEQPMYQPVGGDGMWKRMDILNGGYTDDLIEDQF